MLKLPSLQDLDHALGVKVFLCLAPTDMRRGFDTLAACVREYLGYDPLSGNLFLFVGRGRDRLKLLYWDQDGYALWYKRLEEGVFKLPVVKEAGAAVELKATELAMLLEGIDLKSLRRCRRFAPPGAKKSEKS